MTWDQVKILFEVADYAREHGAEFNTLRNEALAWLKAVDVNALHFSGGNDGEGDSE